MTRGGKGTFEPIAIIGAGCALPGALDPAALWSLVRDERSVLAPVPPGAWGIQPGAPGQPDEIATDVSGSVEGFERVFDAQGLRVPSDLLHRLDVGVRWAVYAARQAIASAGLSGVTQARGGVALGNLAYPTRALADYALATWLGQSAQLRGEPLVRFMSGYPAHLVAAALGFEAGALALDAACASALYAVKLACDRLQERSADVMLAGGLNASDELCLHLGFTALGALSPSGQSRPFHRGADGLVPARGAGFVVLERLSDAVAAGRTIRGVIRGVGLSNDGKRSAGLLVPSSEGQVRAMRAAYAQSGLSPSDISLVECHATGTPIGDAVELASLAEVFRGVSDVPIGSLKSNVGHLITAAGIGGLIKVLGAMEAGVRPASLHTDDTIEVPAPCRLLRAAEPWPDDRPRRAGVSAFGFGGNNAHLIVEEWRPGTSTITRQALSVDPIVVVAQSVVAGNAASADAFVSAYLAGEVASSPEDAAAAPFELDAVELGITPNDLARALPQQLLFFSAAGALRSTLAALPAARTALLVGMQSAADGARYAGRWRASSVSPALPGVEATTVARVLGAMANVVANRVSRRHGFEGPCFSMFGEEASGLVALASAASMLRREEIDAAVVGAVDACCEPVHAGAIAASGPTSSVPGDAAVILVLKRRADALRDGDEVLASVETHWSAAGDAPIVRVGAGTSDLAARFGHAQAASGLLAVSALVGAAARRALPGGEVGAVEVTPLGGTPLTTVVRVDGAVSSVSRAPSVTAAAPSGVRAVLVRCLAQIEPMRKETAVHDHGVMKPAPGLPPVASGVPRASRAPVEMVTQGDDVAAVMIAMSFGHEQLAAAHAAYLRLQTEANVRFTEVMRASMALVDEEDVGEEHVVIAEPAEPVAPPKLVAARRSALEPTGPTFDRAQLEIHASGAISTIFGPLFAQQDEHARQVRMPRPPLLLADRVTGITGEPGSMGTGTVWTETDVTSDAWYLYDGHMPAGIMVESGQADLFLISWLGADFANRGERVYRLLGCELVCHGRLPSIGETLRYDIHVDGHAEQGDVRLFFFHYDCHIGDELRLSVRHGQAGFFTNEELAASAGVLWSAENVEPTKGARLDPPVVVSNRTSFDASALDAFSRGQLRSCFGPGFERGDAHTLTPTIPAGKMRLLESVTHFEPHGGPWKRGYVRAVLPLTPESWFFDGHFQNDPCMPGTLMFEGCLQAMSIYLAGIGYTLAHDARRFEPVTEVTYKLQCRGQATPASREVVYEVFVDEIIDGDVPTLFADVMGSVDGRKAFYCKRMGLRLVPGFPLDPGRMTLDAPRSGRPVAGDAGISFDEPALIACALGKPSDAFGELGRPYDGTRWMQRLPAPPYHFLTRVVRFERGPGGAIEGSEMTAEYDVPPDAWYFADGGAGIMPFAALLEVALQPCGWLSTYVLVPTGQVEDVKIRNLDGKGTAHLEVGPDCKRLTTTARMTSHSQVGELIIVAFTTRVLADERLVYEAETVFGFFPSEALANQVGLTTTDEQRAALVEPCDLRFPINDHGMTLLAGTARIPDGRMRMLDRVSGLWPTGGSAGLGRIRVERDIAPSDWYFKAHFFRDPVQPGSLGVDAMLQTLMVFMLEAGMDQGIAEPRFQPVTTGVAHVWKYRGQVVPANKVVVFDIDITSVTRGPEGATVTGAGSLWVDGKRIYEARGLAMRLVPGGAPAEAPLARRVELDDLWPFWRAQCGIDRGWLGEDLLSALVSRFVRDVRFDDAGTPSAIAARPCLFVANHQVGCESLIAALVLGGMCGRGMVIPAKSEHQETWVGRLAHVLATYPGARETQLVRYVDRKDPASVLAFVADAARDVRAGRSILVHVEGTRSESCRRPTTVLSSVFLDLALELDIPVVPLRFVGGLPVEPSPEKLEFPVGFAAQDYWVGRPIVPSALRAVPFAQRTKVVLEALNGLGVSPAVEEPHAPAPDFAAEVERVRAERGAGGWEAVLLAALASSRHVSEEGQRFLDQLARGARPSEPWQADLARWLLG